MNAQKENRIKLYGVIIGIISLAAQHGIYLLAHEIATWVGIPPFLPKIPMDDLFPIIPVFILPYVWSYIYWGMTPMAVSKCKTDHFLDYLAAYLFSCLAGAVILILAPTYMDRVAEGLYDTSAHSGIFADLMRFWYSLDGSEIAYNLLPSFHCINSTISYLGVAGRKEIPLWYRIYSLLLTVLIFFSTLYVKQHFVLDVISGAAIGVIVFIICKKCHAGRIFAPLTTNRAKKSVE